MNISANSGSPFRRTKLHQLSHRNQRPTTEIATVALPMQYRRDADKGINPCHPTIRTPLTFGLP
ncbi:hypothetical protein [Shimia sp. Alg240-R146]|uniref:hypothetical protein n=1 Tax=Shimia sp. Alg240-R146 TaxID=2993449 RepID=UPI0022E07BD9|nr:hypothetical protein [Shimia sp. Alg240-R146]